jgi:hypothetical protein
MSLRNFFRRKQSDTDATRRTRLLQQGRIADAVVIDVGASDTDDPNVIYFAYQVNGVDYQSSEVLSTEQRGRPLDYTPGASITVRYDPRQPGNSVVV